MYKLKLIRGRSYSGFGVKATNAKPVVEVEDKYTVDCLVASKHFQLIGGARADEEPKGNTPPGDIPNDGWTNAQLDAYAAENGIDLAGAKNKPERLAIIQQALEDNGGLDFTGNL